MMHPHKEKTWATVFLLGILVSCDKDIQQAFLLETTDAPGEKHWGTAFMFGPCAQPNLK